MKIHGLRLYPQTVETVRGRDGSPIFLHGRINDDCSDFVYIFRQLASSWLGHVFVSSFGVSLGWDGEVEDPMPSLRDEFGLSLLGAELDGQLMLLSGDDFLTWAARNPGYCGFLLIFREAPAFDLARSVYWDVDAPLCSANWPEGLRAVVHCWDDIYWQLFSVETSDLEVLIRAHTGDPKLKMLFADFDWEYPDPSNEKLNPATLEGIASDA